MEEAIGELVRQNEDKAEIEYLEEDNDASLADEDNSTKEAKLSSLSPSITEEERDKIIENLLNQNKNPKIKEILYKKYVFANLRANEAPLTK